MTEMYSCETAYETWKVRVQDRVYEADVTELKEWIDEGAVTADDKVQKGNLRWLAAGRVPELATLFAKSDEMASGDGFSDGLYQLERNGFTEAELNGIMLDGEETDRSDDGAANFAGDAFHESDMKHCSVHTDRETVFACNICRTPYCNVCPNRFGSVRLCPSCGGICASYTELLDGTSTRGALNKPYAVKPADEADERDRSSKPGLRDLVDALKTRLHIRSN
jgi:hypothetical protein